MTRHVTPISILMAEDDVEDQMLVREAFEEARLANDIAIVSDGEELLDYLNQRGAYSDVSHPHIILLDLNMPRKDGREALKEIKADPKLRRIPVIVLTTASAEEDIISTYDLGVSSYIRKPVTFDKLVDLIKELGRYWLEIVELPPDI
jgi:two-component system, response regulator